MAEYLTQDTLDQFEEITGYDIVSFFSTYVDFIASGYGDIQNYIIGNSNIRPAKAYDTLNWLLKERKKINDVVILNSSTLINYEFWTLNEQVDSIGHSLESTKNLGRWARAASTNTGSKIQTITEVLLEQGQTLQQLESNVIRSSDPTNTWVDTALSNSLREEDYDSQGGQLIKVTLQNGAAIQLNSVVDNIDDPIKTYGLDISQDISIVNDDLLTLGYVDTALQSIKILTDLNKGDDPSFPNRGLNLKNSVLGGTVAGVSYPVILRDLAANFATDDSFQSISVNDISKRQDAIYLDYTVKMRAGNSFSNSIQL
jgi:hypothetical protein